MPTDRRLSELPWSVDVGAMFDGHDVDTAVLVVDTVDHPVVAAAGTVQPVEPELERLADPVLAASDPYRNSTAATATFSGSRASAQRPGAVHAIAKSPSLTGQRSSAVHHPCSAPVHPPCRVRPEPRGCRPGAPRCP